MKKKYRINYLGKVNHKSIEKVFRQCDIFCVASRDIKKIGITFIAEQFGYVFIEAMASGLPIVTTNAGSILEVIGNENLIVSQNSSEDIYEKLKILVQDSNLRVRIGKVNRKRAERLFNVEEQARKFAQIIKRVI